MFDRNLSRHVVKTKPMSFFSAFTQSIIFFRKESVLDICPFFVYFYLNCRNDFYLLNLATMDLCQKIKANVNFYSTEYNILLRFDLSI